MTTTTSDVTHASFTIERVYPVTPKEVFAAFADEDLKAKWFNGPPEWEPDVRTMDFRIGGRETSEGGPPNEWVSRFEATYYDIVDDERLVYAYEMYIDGRRVSVSLATVELYAEGSSSTRLVATEQGVYLEGGQAAADDREHGFGVLFDQLGAALAGA